jgi:two-component system response regulator EvgA
MQAVMTEFIRTVPGLKLVAVVDGAEDALASFGLHRPDVVIIDLLLRVGFGLDVLIEIKHRAPECLVLIFTSCDAEQYRKRCLAAGADHFFSKIRHHRQLILLLRDLGRRAQSAEPDAPAIRRPNPIGFHEN